MCYAFIHKSIKYICEYENVLRVVYNVLQCHSNESQEVKTYDGREADTKKNLGKTISFFFRNFIQRRSKQNLLLIEIHEIHCLEFFLVTTSESKLKSRPGDGTIKLYKRVNTLFFSLFSHSETVQ